MEKVSNDSAKNTAQVKISGEIFSKDAEYNVQTLIEPITVVLEQILET